MEEVPSHVHSRPIVPDVLSRQHEHRSGLIWNGNHKTCYIDLQCRRFGRKCYSMAPRRLVEIIDRTGYKVKEEPLEAWILRAFTGSETDDNLILCAHGFIFLLIDGHMLSDFSGNLVHWRLRVRDGHAVAAEALSYPSDEYIRWYRGITRVYIGNPVNRDTHSHGYQPTSMFQEMDDMTSVVIQEPPSSLSQMAVFAKKVQTIIHRGARRHLGRGAGGGRPPVPPAPERHEHVDPDHVEVEKGEGSRSGQPTVDLFDSPNLDMPSFSLGLTPVSQSLPSGFGTSQTPPLPSLGFPSFQAPHSTSYVFSTGSSTPHQPISQASSSDKEERADDMVGVQHYGFEHRVGRRL
ncbi:hypothetical protein M9H77_25911 [Catharanthus roseus]|uniref:Uncharacterized protein n=1 Tax=Catharanthus roseus TaxID=4058 RepID=A0ACC0A887_CATRO|nr:hypothetical protein M9H77_25911 [Catharanthus roseus]